ncbi:SDR family oxidoreductase [Roseisolibacter sp. H3M3-2]|uniref:SDR family oxidoreductase n=1 Tax=Roseisolibacter sp. H3M3-2 TaxID=3031323 RepID=UPI0023DA246F|nr:SDR family oxidoreductase [Roseisolibacter sp. H3M3-2]MDF1505420.1 SDR family oxidoreductase [Roseisolibacter sp. H3M3-2]
MSGAPFRGLAVLLTGASSGIGRALARQLAEQGAWLALAARTRDELEEVAAECRAAGAAAGARAVAIPTDVADEAQCRAAVERAVAEFGRLDVLVANAGISMWARFDALRDLEGLERIMRVNYFGAVYCAFHALPHLKRARGRIVAVSSLTGKTGVPTRTGYAASKHAMAGFFDSLRIELADEGVSVTVVYPGFVATGVRRHAVGPDGRPLGESPVQESKVMTPDECARLTLRAAARRDRELVMTARGRVGQWLKLIAPGLTDRIARRAIEEGR